MTDLSNLPPVANPLQRYFRIPALNIELPTRGVFFPPGGIELNLDGTVPVYPMRGQDEYLLKTPDALLSGYAIEKIVESCIPAIKMPRAVSTCDLDVILLAIRAATSGNTMEISASCPKCDHENTFDCDLPTILSTMTHVDGPTEVRLSDDLVAYVRPYNFKNASNLSLTTFNESRKLQQMQEDQDATEEARTIQLKSSMDEITKLNSALMSDCVMKIVTPDGVVTNPTFIKEFMSEAPRKVIKAIEAALDALNQTGIDKTIDVQCMRTECRNEWKTQIEFDPSNFFE